jgi:dinuclear metal center YbgI/SA1388 family protein
MTIKNITQFLERIAPPQYQEAYDNAGLIVGNPNAEVTGILTCLDSLEATIDEAIERGCNLIVAHHPIVFKGLKKLTGKNYVERIVLKAIKNDVALYAIHTNLDNVLHKGVNTRICERLGLKNLKILAPKRQILMKLTTFVPIPNTQTVLAALYAAGAGHIGNYKNCSFRTEGIGTFRPTSGANPYIGTLEKDEEVHEHRVEVVFPQYLESKIMAALRAAHPYEEVAYYLHLLENTDLEVGSGMVGDLENGMNAADFLHFLKKTMQTACVKFTNTPLSKNIQKVAVCGGSGSFLLGHAMGAGADAFVTADYKYHEFFDADGKILIADIGHFESEQFTIGLLQELLEKEFPQTRVFSTQIITNPVNYL